MDGGGRVKIHGRRSRTSRTLGAVRARSGKSYCALYRRRCLRAYNSCFAVTQMEINVPADMNEDRVDPCSAARPNYILSRSLFPATYTCGCAERSKNAQAPLTNGISFRGRPNKRADVRGCRSTCATSFRLAKRLSSKYGASAHRTARRGQRRHEAPEAPVAITRWPGI